MSSILMTWLNTEVDLSRKITNIESDFSNGYLLGELLHKFNQLTNIYDFKDENNRNARLNNFTILHEVLHNVGVKFSPNTAESIMEEKKGVVSNLLYEIRSNLEKKGVNPENISLKKSSHFQEMYSPMKFRQEIPQYDSFQNKHFLDSLQRKTRSQKEADLEKKIKRFEEFKHQQDEKIAQAIAEEKYQKKIELDTQIKNHRNKNQRYHAFLQQFEEKGINNWKNNMVKTKEREIKDLNFQLKEAKKISNALKRGQDAIASEYIRNVAKFEANIYQAKAKKEDLNDNGSGNVDLMETSRESCPFQSVGAKCEPIINKIRSVILLNPSTKTERTRRRRKIIVEQSKAQLEIENKRRETQYTLKLNKQSNQEKQLTYEGYRVNQSKNIIMENRNLRDEMYLERLEQDKKFLQINEEDFLKYNRENNKREQEKEEQRKKDLYISLKQKERNVNSDVFKEIINLVVDIADEAYIYQQINDTEDIDFRVWREWTNILINNQSVLDKDIIEEHNPNQDQSKINEGEEINEEQLEVHPNNGDEEEGKKEEIKAKDEVEKGIFNPKKFKYNNTFYSIFNADAQCTKLDSILDECEFIDYINYNGQWNTSLIPESALITLTPQDLLFDYIVPANQADPNLKKDKGGAKNVNAQKGGTKDNTEDLLKEDDPENLVIPKENIQNVFFGDLIDILIEMRYEDNNQNKKEENKLLFRYIPIKIAIIGQDFSGKKTQAKILSENFPFKIYNFEQMVKSALELLSHKSETSSFIYSTKDLIKDNDQEQSDKADEITQMRNEQAQEEAKLARIKELASEIKELLLNGEPISDQIYADLLIEYIKKDFQPKEDSEVKKEIIERVQQKEDLLAEIKENIEINSNRPKAFEKKDQELNQQLMKLSLEGSKGFIVVNYPNTFRQAKLLEMKLSGYIPECDSHQLESNILKKAFDIVLDKSSKILPPVKLLQGGFDYIFYLDVPSSECVRRAVGRRVYKNPKGETVIYHLEDNPPPTTSNICEKLVKVKEVSTCESTLITRHLAFDTAINQIIEFYQPFGFEYKQLKSFQKIDGAKGKEYVTHDLVSFINQLVQINEEKDKEIYDQAQEEEEEDDSMQDLNINKEISELNDKSDNNIMKDADNIENDIALVDSPQKKEQIEKQVTELEPYAAYVQKIQSIKAAINKDLSVVLLKIWTELYENYVSECKSIFKFLRVQRDSISNNYNIICQKYIEFLKRPSKKQILLLDYQMKYNKFLDDYPDLKDDPQVKEEHHQEVDDLNDKIYEIIETRKNEAVDERKKIMTSGWIENEMEKFYMALERLFQNEIDKFIGSMQIMRDYYHNLDNRPLIELPFTTIDIIKEEIDTTPIEQVAEGGDINKSLPESYPRIEKLYKNCLKIQFQYEEAIKESERQKAEKGDAGNKKQAAAKNVKKGQAQSQHTEEVKEVYQHGDELKKALSNEKAKYKYKITLLKYWGLKCLKNLRNLSLSVYSKLEDWIILAIKAENEALNQLTNMLKDNIETESKIKYELALDTFDVIVNMDVQNYMELPPQPLPAKEIIDHNKFNIVQLRILLEELETYLIEDSRNIRSSTFISIFIKKFIASKNDNDAYYGIPDLLKQLSFHNYFKFIKKLDPENTDLVSLNQIITYFCLLTANIPKESDIKVIISQLEKMINYYDSPECSKEQFILIKFWFDSTENSETLPNHEDYHRSDRLKEILYDVNQEDNMINMNTFISIINLNCLNLEYEKYENKSYYEVLFF